MFVCLATRERGRERDREGEGDGDGERCCVVVVNSHREGREDEGKDALLLLEMSGGAEEDVLCDAERLQRRYLKDAAE